MTGVPLRRLQELARFAKSDDDASFQRDVREMRQISGAICRRSQSSGDTQTGDTQSGLRVKGNCRSDQAD
jgi:hypothetical protein